MEKLATTLPERAAKMNRRVLLGVLIAFSVLVTGACGWIIYRSIVHLHPLYRVVPIRPPILLHEIPGDSIYYHK